MRAAGRLDGEAVERVLAAAGHRRSARPPLPAGLTTREAEVLRLLALGLTSGRSRTSWLISAKTADHHVQHIYTKIGVSTRGAARCSPSSTASWSRNAERKLSRLQSRSPINIRRSAGDWIQLPPRARQLQRSRRGPVANPVRPGDLSGGKRATAAPFGTARGRRCRRRRRAAAVTATQPSAFSASPKRSGPRGPPTLPWG